MTQNASKRLPGRFGISFGVPRDLEADRQQRLPLALRLFDKMGGKWWVFYRTGLRKMNADRLEVSIGKVFARVPDHSESIRGVLLRSEIFENSLHLFHEVWVRHLPPPTFSTAKTFAQNSALTLSSPVRTPAVDCLRALSAR